MLTSVRRRISGWESRIRGTGSRCASGRVIVTFLPKPKVIDLERLGHYKGTGRRSARAFEHVCEDWNRPEMDVYDVD